MIDPGISPNELPKVSPLYANWRN